MVKLVNSKEFNEFIQNDVVFVDFFAKWCGPCKMISPIVEAVSNEINDVKFIKVDVDECPEIAGAYGIMSIPTLMIFKNGKLIEKKIGFINKEGIIDFINRNK